MTFLTYNSINQRLFLSGDLKGDWRQLIGSLGRLMLKILEAENVFIQVELCPLKVG